MANVDQTNITRKEKRNFFNVKNALAAVLVRKEKPKRRPPKVCDGCTGWDVI
jgi:hypothetical protein